MTGTDPEGAVLDAAEPEPDEDGEPEQRTMITRAPDGTYTVVRRHTYGDHGRYGIRAQSGCGAVGGAAVNTATLPLLLAWQPGLGDLGDGVLTGHSPDLDPGIELTAEFPDGTRLTAVSKPGGVVSFGEHSLSGGEHTATVTDPAGDWAGRLTIEIPVAAAEPVEKAAPRVRAARRSRK